MAQLEELFRRELRLHKKKKDKMAIIQEMELRK
jgi:hypothetical protein